MKKIWTALVLATAALVLSMLTAGALYSQSPDDPATVLYPPADKVWYEKPDTLITIVIALLAVFIAWWQARLQRKSIELSIFEGVFRDIREAEREYKEKYEFPLLADLDRYQPGNAGQVEEIEEVYDAALNLTASVLFNTLEYMALLLNHHHVKDESLVSYFDDMLPVWLGRLDGHTIPDPKKSTQAFPEFRRLCLERGIEKGRPAKKQFR